MEAVSNADTVGWVQDIMFSVPAVKVTIFIDKLIPNAIFEIVIPVVRFVVWVVVADWLDFVGGGQFDQRLLANLHVLVNFSFCLQERDIPLTFEAEFRSIPVIDTKWHGEGCDQRLNISKNELEDELIPVPVKEFIGVIKFHLSPQSSLNGN